MRRFWRKYHKWAGLVFTLFILVFCVSGIILNHRKFFSKCEVSRSLLPGGYSYENWNNGVVKGTLRLDDGRVLAYGNTGVWMTDTCFSTFVPMSGGLAEGIDNKKVSNVVRTSDGTVWCAALFGVYRLEGETWKLAMEDADGERIADICDRGDTLVVLSRSCVYQAVRPFDKFERIELKAPADYNPEVTMFRTIWLLHSGALFGLTGRLIIDLVAVVIIILCVTGLVYTFVPMSIKRRKRAGKNTRALAKTLKYSVKWHNGLGAWLLVLTVLLAFTGACLRKPLTAPLAKLKTQPVPGSTLAADNVWNDKMRGIRWDETLQSWLLSTSGGFYRLKALDGVPEEMKGAPKVSSMGVNAFCRESDSTWVVGSFSGLYRWNPSEGASVDYYTGKSVKKHGKSAKKHGKSAGKVTVSGYSSDLLGKDIVFEYRKGATDKTKEKAGLPQMPEELRNQPMSLWNFALELHVGRPYEPFLGPLSSWFIFISGVLLTLILISGYIVYKKKR